MQKAAFEAAGIGARYEALDVPLERLDDVLGELHAEGVVGLNLTLPLKERGFELASTRTPEADRRTEVRVLDIFQNAASVRIDAGGWVDYLHLVRWRGQWVILNVLWELRPPAPGSAR